MWETAKHCAAQRARFAASVGTAHSLPQGIAPDGVTAADIVENMPVSAAARRYAVTVDAEAYRPRAGNEDTARAVHRAAQCDLMVAAEAQYAAEMCKLKLPVYYPLCLRKRQSRCTDAQRGAPAHIPAGGKHLIKARAESVRADGGDVERAEALTADKAIIRITYFKARRCAAAVYSSNEHISPAPHSLTGITPPHSPPENTSESAARLSAV